MRTPQHKRSCRWRAPLRGARPTLVQRRTAAHDVCRAEYVATLEEALAELEQFVGLLRQLARSGTADAMARIARLLDTP